MVVAHARHLRTAHLTASSLIADQSFSRAAWPLTRRIKAGREQMNDLIKAALVLGILIFAATGLWIYFLPYHSCVRALAAQYAAPATVKPGAPDFSEFSTAVEVETNEHRLGRAAINCSTRLGRG